MQQLMDSIVHLWPVLAAIGGGFLWLCRWFAKRSKAEDARLMQRLDTLDSSFAAVSEGLQATLRQSLIDNHVKYMARGYITIHGLEHMEKMYKAYTMLGGNSFVGELMKDIRDLPVK